MVLKSKELSHLLIEPDHIFIKMGVILLVLNGFFYLVVK
jgi:hypothetical protein